MRGPSKSLPSYRKHRSSGQAVVTLSGKDYYLGPYGTRSSKIEYDRLIGEWLANGRRPLCDRGETDTFTVAKLSAAYWRHCKSFYVKNGKATDEQAGVKAALKVLKVNYAKTLASEFGPLALEAVREQMVARGNSRRYINQNVGRIKRMFRWGVSKEIVPIETYQRLTTVVGLKKGKCSARETAPVLPVDDSVVEATLQHVNATVADMIRIQRLTACRPGEVCAMRPIDIDQEPDEWLYLPASHKMEHKERHRVIVIGLQAQRILTKYLSRDETEYCFIRRGKVPYETGHYHQHIQRACDKAFPPPDSSTPDEAKAWRKRHRWAPNQLRHSAGTEIRAKFGIEASQVVLGHSKIETTQVYAERDIALASRIMAEIG